MESLRCTGCGQGGLFLEKAKSDGLEVRQGEIVCKRCRASYGIENGVADFLTSASQGAMRERHAMDNNEYIVDALGNRYTITDETIEKFREQFLSLPEGDGSYFFKRGGSFQSIREASSRFYSALNYLNLTGEETVLEIGACFSYASYQFAQKGCKVVALDISNYIKAAEVYVKKAYFDRVFSDLHTMPFIDNIFDIVFGSAVLHHSKDLKGAFREIHRVLKPGGRLLLVNESARGMFERVHPVFKEMENKGFGDTSYTIFEWKKEASGGGFRKVKVDLLSLADDYITRHKNKDSNNNLKLRLAYYIRNHKRLERFLSALLIGLRLLFRPKSWRLTCYK